MSRSLMRNLLVPVFGFLQDHLPILTFDTSIIVGFTDRTDLGAAIFIKNKLPQYLFYFLKNENQ